MAYSESDVNLQTVIHFSCPSGLTLTGLNTTTYVNESHWVPDPIDVKCIHIDGMNVVLKSVVVVSLVP